MESKKYLSMKEVLHYLAKMTKFSLNRVIICIRVFFFRSIKMKLGILVSPAKPRLFIQLPLFKYSALYTLLKVYFAYLVLRLEVVVGRDLVAQGVILLRM